MNKQRELIILKSNQLNSACQALNLPPPKRIELSYGTQLIPTILIGSLHFYSPNWLLAKDDKLIRLLDFIIDRLNNTKFIEENSSKLKSSPISFNSVFCNESIEPFIKEFTQDFP